MNQLVPLLTLSILAAQSASALIRLPPPGGSTPPSSSPGLACAAPPAAPHYLTAGDHGATSLGISFSDSGSCETSYEVQHRNADLAGSWVTRATLPASASTSTSFVDTNLSEDTYYCYRVKARNSYGATATTSQLCMKTRQVTANQRRLHDVRVRVKVAPFSGAGTDSPVRARLNAVPTSGWYPIGNETWLDYGRDDFRTGDTWTFVLGKDRLASDGAPIHTDVSQIVLDVQGSDTLCVSEIELLVNGRSAFSGSYGTTSSTARCGSQGSPITVTKAELRASALFRNFTADQPPLDLSEFGIASTIEAALGDRMHGTPVYWDAEPAPHAVTPLWLGLQANPETNEGFILNLPLRAAVDNWFDPQVLIQLVMDMESTCTANRTTVTISTSQVWADVGFDWWADVVHTLATAGIYFLLEPTIDGHAEGEIEPTSMEVSLPIDGCYVVTYEQGYGFTVAAR